MMQDPRSITYCTHLLLCIKNLERMGDHATNVAEIVYDIVEGHGLQDERPKVDTTRIAPNEGREIAQGRWEGVQNDRKRGLHDRDFICPTAPKMPKGASIEAMPIPSDHIERSGGQELVAFAREQL